MKKEKEKKNTSSKLAIHNEGNERKRNELEEEKKQQ